MDHRNANYTGVIHVRVVLQVLNLEDAAPPPPSQLNSELLKVFAVEAEQCGDYDLAGHYYKEVGLPLSSSV